MALALAGTLFFTVPSTEAREAAAALAGAAAERLNAYPAWEPDLESPLLARCKQVYQSLFDVAPHVEAIHAGLECAVIGAPHPDWGEEVVAFVVRQSGGTDDAGVPDANELDQLCLSRIARFKRPKRYRFVADLPKNN